MDKVIFFLHIIAWPTAIICSLIGFVTMISAINYPGSVDETIDKLNGIKVTFHPLKFLVIALICWAFIIAF